MRPIRVRAVLLVLACLLVTSCGAQEGVSSSPAPDDHAGASWRPVAQAPLSARHDPVVLAVGDRYVVLGGVPGDPCPPNASCVADPPPLADGASYDPSRDRWTRLADAPEGVSALESPTSVVAGGTVYVQALHGILGYDVEHDAWHRVARPEQRFTYLAAAGERLVAFDYAAIDRPRASVLDAETGRWSALPPDPLGRVTDRWLVGVDGGLAVAGHGAVPDDEPPLVKVALLDDDLTTWGPARTVDVVGWAPAGVAGRLVWQSTQTADGGATNGWGRAYPEGGVLDPATGRFTAMTKPPTPVGGMTTSPTTDRLAGVSGHLLDPVTGDWTRVPEPPGGSRDGAGWAGSSRGILMWGGATFGGAESTGSSATGYLLDPSPSLQ